MTTEEATTDLESITLTRADLKALVNEAVQEALTQHIEGALPPDTYRRREDGLLYRDKEWDETIEVADPENPGKTKFDVVHRIQHRHVTLDFNEAQLRHWDYYHSPQLGWVNEGYKLEADRTPQAIFADATETHLRPQQPDELTVSSAASLYKRPMTEGE